jgi:hypothetical protein
MFKLNKKNLGLEKLLSRDNPRLRHLHVSGRGSTIVQPSYWCRVSLPNPSETWPPYLRLANGDEIDAKTTPDHLVPNVENLIPAPSEQTCTVTVNGATLAKILKVANEVNEDPLKTVRLRWCPDRGVLRIDTFAAAGDQSFLGVIRPVEYHGPDIAGDIEKDIFAGGRKMEKPVQLMTPIKVSDGRRFRSE